MEKMVFCCSKCDTKMMVNSKNFDKKIICKNCGYDFIPASSDVLGFVNYEGTQDDPVKTIPIERIKETRPMLAFEKKTTYELNSRNVVKKKTKKIEELGIKKNESIEYFTKKKYSTDEKSFRKLMVVLLIFGHIFLFWFFLSGNLDNFLKDFYKKEIQSKSKDKEVTERRNNDHIQENLKQKKESDEQARINELEEQKSKLSEHIEKMQKLIDELNKEKQLLVNEKIQLSIDNSKLENELFEIFDSKSIKKISEKEIKEIVDSVFGNDVLENDGTDLALNKKICKEVMLARASGASQSDIDAIIMRQLKESKSLKDIYTKIDKASPKNERHHLFKYLIDTVWGWDGDEGTIKFAENKHVYHLRGDWSARGNYTIWEVIDRRTVLFLINKYGEVDRYAILIFSEDLRTYSGYNFHNCKRFATSYKK